MARGATPLTEAQFVEEVVTRIENGDVALSKAQVKAVVKAFKEEIVDCLANGYKVSLSGLLTLTPVAKPGRKKGTVVRNPFDGSTKTLRADESDKFKVRPKVSTAVLGAFPSAKSTAGQGLLKQLKPPAKKKSK